MREGNFIRKGNRIKIASTFNKQLMTLLIKGKEYSGISTCMTKFC